MFKIGLSTFHMKLIYKIFEALQNGTRVVNKKSSLKYVHSIHQFPLLTIIK